MLEQIIQEIDTTLTGITAIKEVYDWPLDGSPKKFPAAIYFFDRFDNSYLTNKDNFKVMEFKIYLVVSVAGSNTDTVYSSVMPKLIDKVVQEFDESWSARSIGSYRAWSLINGGTVTLSQEQKGVIATCELNLQVRVSNSI